MIKEYELYIRRVLEDRENYYADKVLESGRNLRRMKEEIDNEEEKRRIYVDMLCDTRDAIKICKERLAEEIMIKAGFK